VAPNVVEDHVYDCVLREAFPQLPHPAQELGAVSAPGGVVDQLPLLDGDPHVLRHAVLSPPPPAAPDPGLRPDPPSSRSSDNAY